MSRTREKHRNIALFVAHQGCPFLCSFCNQTAITGVPDSATPEDVHAAMKTALADGRTGGQLAFFGGSFTLIDAAYRRALLEAAAPYIASGVISGIRISTRPDGIDESILKELKHYGTEAIELGAQSMDNAVLKKNRRGHTAEDTVRASALIKDAGFELGLQMMTGLYGDTSDGAIRTAKALAELHPDTVRIYPTVVLEGTELYRLYERGDYVPEPLDEAVSLCADLLTFFEAEGIRVIRLGLHSGGNTEAEYVSGPYHPAFRELVEGKRYERLFLEQLSPLPKGAYEIYGAPFEISKMAGQKRQNILKLKDMGYDIRLKQAEDVSPYEIRVKPVKKVVR